MVLCLLALYPASWLDWPVLARLTAASFFMMPGMPGKLPPSALPQVAHLGQVLLVPLARLLTAVALVFLSLTRLGSRAGRAFPLARTQAQAAADSAVDPPDSAVDPPAPDSAVDPPAPDSAGAQVAAGPE